MKIIILFGPPFSGKGTQGKLLAGRINYRHISTGEILRHEKEHNTAIGVVAREYSSQGLLAPDILMEKIIDREMANSTEEKGIILDGYPRTIPQVETLARLCKKYKVEIQKVVFLEVSEEELIARAIERGESSGREDDKDPIVIQRRVEVYYSETEEVADFYSRLKLVARVKGVGSIEEITENIISAL